MHKHQLLALIFTLTFSSCASLKQWQDLPTSKADEQHFYLLSHGWHTGIVIPTIYLDERFDFLRSYFGYSAYYEFGWGDADFYPAQSNTIILGLKALFWPTSAVMHVAALPVKPQNYFIGTQTLEIKTSSQGMKNLINYIDDSFRKDRSGERISTQRGLYGRSFFFQATGSFFMTRTCNTWTSEALEKAGLPVSSFLTLSSSSVMNQTQKAIKSYPKLP